MMASTADEPDHPTQIGRYRILQILGEGGMGVVFEAEQTEPVRRRVAVKTVKSGMDTRQVLARFESERQALAVMDHPSIAKVLDAGATDTGRPYFVMELVRGIPLTEYCDRHQLSTARRLELFASVCEAVQHAHHKGVIHRDLKPSNILVTAEGKEPTPKVIDFGIAKAIGGRLTDHTFATQLGEVVGTPAYMSPEQAERSALDVDTRTDVFTLGVILYELLTGTLPFDVGSAAASPVVPWMLLDEDPPTPSARFDSLGDGRKAIAERRRTSPEVLRGQLTGDLDWIVLKAMAKDRTLRYETANGFALDIRRFLHDEPVLARPPSTRYRVAKFVKRHRTAVLAASVAALALVAGAVMATVGLVRAWRAEVAAEQEAAVATRTTDFLVGLFRVSDPAVARGRDPTLREVLDSGATRIEQLTDAPAVQAQIMRTIGAVYSELGRYDRALPLFDTALARYTEAYGPGSPRVAETQVEMAHFLILMGDYDRADTLNRAALATFGRVYGDDAQATIDALNNLVFGFLRSGRHIEEGERLLRAALPGARAALGDRHESVAGTMDHLCWTLLGRSPAAADSVCQATLDLRRELYPGDHPVLGYTLKRVAAARRALGRYDEALAALQEARAMEQRLYGDVHPEVAYTLLGLASTYRAMGQPATALPLAQQAVAMQHQVLPDTNAERAQGLGTLGAILGDLRRFDEAIAVLQEALGLDRAVFGNESRRVADRLIAIGLLENQRGNPQAARQVNEEALGISRRLVGADDPALITPLTNLASTLQRLGDAAGAEPLFREAMAITQATARGDGTSYAMLQTDLARVLTDRGRYEEGCAVADSARADLVQRLSADHWRVAVARTVLGHCQARWGKFADAEPNLVDGFEALRATRPDGDRYRVEAAEFLVNLYEHMRRPDAARRYRTILAAERAAGMAPGSVPR
jgi:tetratricopeptide (TPR) repeat protein